MKQPVDAPGSRVGQETLSVLESAQAIWRGELAELGGRNGLLWHREMPTGTLDLTVAHPGGVAKLLAGHSTLLSELVRESVALAETRRRLTAIRAKALELQREHGLSVLFLAVGMASWHLPRAPIPPRAPVLLRGARIRPTDATRQDYVLRLDSDVVFNPALEHYLRGERGIELDGQELARGSSGRHGFDPRPTYDALEQACEGIPEFGIGPQLVLSTYPLAKLPLVAELSGPVERLAQRPLVVSLATRLASQDAPEASTTPTQFGSAEAGATRVAAYDDSTVLEADRSQREVLDRLDSGSSLVLDAEPGTGRTQTIVNAVARRLANGGTVLVAAEHRQSLEDVHQQLRSLGMGDLVLDVRESPAAARRAAAELVDDLDRARHSALATGEEDAVRAQDEDAGGARDVEAGGAEDVDRAATESRTPGDPLAVLQRHEDYLHGVREPWGVTLAETQDVLTRLAGLEQPPASHVRLERDVLTQLTTDAMGEVRDALTRAVSAGAWVRRGEDPWFGAQITSPEDADRAATIVSDLVTGRFTSAREEVNALCDKVGLPPPVNIQQWSRTFDLLRRVRDTLDVFTPQVYEAPLDELVQARTKHPRGSADKLPAMARSRLRRQARSLLRPGTPPPDLADRLTHAREERAEWESLAGRAARPSTPRGWEEAAQEYAELHGQLSWLAEVLEPVAAGRDLETTHLDLLLERLIRLDARADRLPVVAAVHADLQPLRDRGLGLLVDDLARRGVAAEHVEAEADLVFWASLHDQVAAGEGQTTSAELRSALTELETLGREGLEAARAAVLEAARQRVAVAVARHEEQEEALRSVVDAGPPLRMTDLFEAAPDLIRVLRPCWLASTLTIPATVPVGTTVDLLVIDEAQRVPLAHAVPALTRAEQVLVVGDSGGLPATMLTTVVDERARPRQDVSDSVLAAAAAVLPAASLANHYRALDQRMLPRRAGSTVAGFPGVRLPSRVTHVEATDLEALIGTVVDVVLDHGQRTPDHSLGVVVDDIAIVEALEHALRDRAGAADVAGAFREDVSEPFLLSTVESAAGDVRDRMIVVLTGRADLDAAWAGAALGSARRSVVVVSDGPLEGLPDSPGRTMVRETIAAARSEVGRESAAAPALIADLATRLRAEGLTVRCDFGEGPHRIELVVDDPDEPERPLLAIDTDALPARDGLDPDRLRTRSTQLRRLGWTPVRVWTTDVFRDPAREVARLVDVARRAAQARGR
ncbi:DUF4011 domain-containing protein [Ornithinimicrobium cryptoxanthini]|uniref:DUF4011 domain-containing protein n=1 Tax=Ornithinimicrobium cryptoxanthini TaxID=2934161 RepID=A0ABY4YGD5_9MICO|nr:DUF4011 domain-containing protein [Ornithinimicrobium cryptoxanthini]USQ75838.1 DUF4011 domain-containing protein [Ornithinimicrobium cryptoxanthini]